MALLILALSSCATAVKEEDFFTDRGNDGAVETHFFSSEIVDIGKAAWDSMREGMTCMSGQAIADIKLEIEELCSKTACDEVDQQTSENTALNTSEMLALRRNLRALRLAFSRIPSLDHAAN
jgi:hypothetical protein